MAYITVRSGYLTGANPGSSEQDTGGLRLYWELRCYKSAETVTIMNKSYSCSAGSYKLYYKLQAWYGVTTSANYRLTQRTGTSNTSYVRLRNGTSNLWSMTGQEPLYANRNPTFGNNNPSNTWYNVADASNDDYRVYPEGLISVSEGATLSLNLDYAIGLYYNNVRTADVTATSASTSVSVSGGKYALTISAGTGSTITVTRGGSALSNGAAIYTGDVLTITSSASTGYNASLSVTGATKSGNNYTVTGNVTAKTTTSLKTYTLTISQGSGSTITVKKGSTTLSNGATVTHGDKLTISFAANTGYNLGTHTVNGSTFTSGGTHTVSGAVSVVSTAAKKTFTLSISAGANSGITVTRGGTALSNGATITYGDVLTVGFSASTGYDLTTHTVNGAAFTSGGAHTVTGAVSVVSAAAKKTFTFHRTQGTGTTLTATKNGSAIADGATVTYGDVLTITAAANTGFTGLSLSVTGATKSGNSYTVTGNVTATSSATAGASAIASCSSAVTTVASDGANNFSLTVTRYSSAYWHKATFSATGMTSVTSNAFQTNLACRIDHSWFNSFPSSASVTVTVTVRTYTTSACTTQVGSAVTRTFTLNLNSSQKPAIGSGFAAAAAYNTGTAASSITGYVQGYSKARLTLTKNKLTMAAGAAVASYKVACQGVTKTVSSPGATAAVDTNTLSGSSAVTITVTVTDSRGRTASTSLSVTPMAYAKPTLSGVSVYRCDANGSASDEGAYFRAKATAGCSSLNGQNSVTLKAKYKSVSAADYGSETTLTSGSYSRLGGSLSADVSYVVMLTATDSLGSSVSAAVTLPTVAWAMKFRPNGNGVGFGMVPQADCGLYIPQTWDLHFGSETHQRRIQRLYATRGVEIPSYADLDDYYNPGSYYCVSGDVAQSLYHSPVSAKNFRLEVISSGALSLENIVQFLWSSHVSTVYFRRRAGGVWTGWAKMLDAYLPTETDSYTAVVGVLNGVIIANAKTIYFDLTTSKSMELINSVSVTSLKLAIFGVNGNIASSKTSTEWAGKSGITVSAVKIKNNKLRIALANTSAFANATDSTPVSAIGTFTLSFA